MYLYQGFSPANVSWGVSVCEIYVYLKLKQKDYFHSNISVSICLGFCNSALIYRSGNSTSFLYFWKRESTHHRWESDSILKIPYINAMSTPFFKNQYVAKTVKCRHCQRCMSPTKQSTAFQWMWQMPNVGSTSDIGKARNYVKGTVQRKLRWVKKVVTIDRYQCNVRPLSIFFSLKGNSSFNLQNRYQRLKTKNVEYPFPWVSRCK